MSKDTPESANEKRVGLIARQTLFSSGESDGLTVECKIDNYNFKNHESYKSSIRIMFEELFEEIFGK